MGPKGRALAVKVAKRLLTDEEFHRFEQIKIKDQGHGYDIWGYEWESGLLGYAAGVWFHKNYFRVESVGHENIPKEGGAMLAANHSGVVPADGAMAALDLILKMTPPRVCRGVVDRGMISLPFVQTFLHRIGMVTGTRKDFELLL